jgi:hypothetical protein
MKAFPSKQFFDIHVKGENINPTKIDQNRDLGKLGPNLVIQKSTVICWLKFLF